MKTKISLLLTLFLLLASCQQENTLSLGDASGKEIAVHIKLKLNNMVTGLPVSIQNSTSKSTRSVAELSTAIENTINDVWVLQYAPGGVLLQSQHLPSGTNFNDFSLTLAESASCNIYFVANEGADARLFCDNPPINETVFLSSTEKYDGEAALTNQSTGIPMVGTLLNQNITSTATLSTFSVKLKRLLARVDFTYSSIVPDFTLSSLRVRNVPAAMGYYPTAAGTVYPSSTSSFIDLPYENAVVASPTSVTKTYYLPVNMQGSNANTDPTNKTGVGFPCATYFELLGGAATNIRYYSYYVGSGAGDYNVEADKYYKITATIKGTSLTDKRVTEAPNKPLEPESNCYIVKPGTTIFIPVSRAEAANAYIIKNDDAIPYTGNGTGFIVSSDFTAGLLWSDVNASDISVKALLLARCIKVVVPLGASAGNSVIYAKSTISPYNIVWSWHIWVTDFDPVATAISLNNISFMDRNLGATTNKLPDVTQWATVGNKTDVGSFGLFYQWGRKDPFPSVSSIPINAAGAIGSFGDANKPIVYDGVGNKLANTYGAPNIVPTIAPLATTDALNHTENLVVSIANPSAFITTEGYDWYSINSGIKNDDLWGALDTVYDPCPVGWRVPLDGSWIGLSTKKDGTLTSDKWDDFSLFKWSSENKFIGRVTAAGLNYPASGRRSGSGQYYEVGTYGCCWSRSVLGTQAWYLDFSRTDVRPSTRYYFSRANGFSVRCVQK